MNPAKLDETVYQFLRKDKSRLHKPFDLGVELEAEGENLPPIGREGHSSKFWKTVQEGSLRNGLEYVLKQPMPLDKLPKVLEEWEKLSKDTEFFDSLRTSTHIHVNVEWLGIKNLLNTIGTWWLVENVLVNTQGPTRTGNLFCLRCEDAESLSHLIIEELSRGQLFRDSLSEINRYAAMNLSSIAKFGSVEFRFMKGMYTASELMKWCTELHGFVRKSSAIDNLDIVLACLKNYTSERFLSLFFSPSFVAELLETENVKRNLKRNSGLVKELSLAIKAKPKLKLAVSEHEDLREVRLETDEATNTYEREALEFRPVGHPRNIYGRLGLNVVDEAAPVLEEEDRAGQEWNNAGAVLFNNGVDPAPQPQPEDIVDFNIAADLAPPLRDPAMDAILQWREQVERMNNAQAQMQGNAGPQPRLRRIVDVV